MALQTALTQYQSAVGKDVSAYLAGAMMAAGLQEMASRDWWVE